MNIHHLKCWPEYFSAVETGAKTFEIRKNDRDYKVGDTLILKEWIPYGDGYTGNTLTRTISYMTDFGQKPEMVVLGIK